MKKLLLLLLLVSVSLTSFAKGKENLKFQCTLKNGKVITVHSTKSDYIYRASKNGQVEIEIKENKDKIERNHWRLADQLTSLHFPNGKYDYEVYSGRYFDPDNKAKDYEGYFDGVDVSKNYDLISEQFCVKVDKRLSID